MSLVDDLKHAYRCWKKRRHFEFFVSTQNLTKKPKATLIMVGFLFSVAIDIVLVSSVVVGILQCCLKFFFKRRQFSVLRRFWRLFPRIPISGFRGRRSLKSVSQGLDKRALDTAVREVTQLLDSGTIDTGLDVGPIVAIFVLWRLGQKIDKIVLEWATEIVNGDDQYEEECPQLIPVASTNRKSVNFHKEK